MEPNRVKSQSDNRDPQLSGSVNRHHEVQAGPEQPIMLCGQAHCVVNLCEYGFARIDAGSARDLNQAVSCDSISKFNGP